MCSTTICSESSTGLETSTSVPPDEVRGWAQTALSTGAVAKAISARNRRNDMTSQTSADTSLDIIERPGGYSAIELAHIIKGPLAAQPQVNGELHKLTRRGLVERRGIGGGNLPYRYYRTNTPRN
jgi:hypothetical protein